MSDHNQYNYVNPNKLSLDWECLIISKTDMLLDGVPKELINFGWTEILLSLFNKKIMKLTLKLKMCGMR